MATDLELLAAWQRGDTRAGNAIYRRHFVGLRAYFSSRVAEADEALIQETFTRVLENPGNYRNESSFKTYLFGIARNVYLEHVRECVRQGFAPERDAIADASGRRQSSILAEREELRLLLDALRAIPADKQDLLELHYVQEMTLVEIAPIFDVSVNTLKSRLRLARQKLLQCYLALADKPHARDLDEADMGVWLESVRAVARQGARREGC